MLIPAVYLLFMLIHYGFCSIYAFFYIKYSNISKIRNNYICKTVQKKQASLLRLGTARIFVDRTGAAGLAFSTGSDQPVEILDLTGKIPAGLNTELNRRETSPFNISKRMFDKF
jgi:hypothetical protein